MVAFRDEGIKIFYSISLALFVVKAWQEKDDLVLRRVRPYSAAPAAAPTPRASPLVP